MGKVNASELEGAALDYCVAMAIGETLSCEAIQDGFILVGAGEGNDPQRRFSPSSDWSHGGPLIEREEVTLDPSRSGSWSAATGNGFWFDGSGPLIAACRAIVSGILGGTVEIPDELLQTP